MLEAYRIGHKGLHWASEVSETLHASSLLNEMPRSCAALLVSDHPPDKHTLSQMRVPQQLPHRSHCRTECCWSPAAALPHSLLMPCPAPKPQGTTLHKMQTRRRLYLQRQCSLCCKGKGRRRGCRIRATLTLCRWKRTSTTHSRKY